MSCFSCVLFVFVFFNKYILMMNEKNHGTLENNLANSEANLMNL